ncbi:MAG TPA: amidohydrolase family protein [Longilinea sp.]|nr:amidohydrolase family protein [Longilinea sp.]
MKPAGEAKSDIYLHEFEPKSMLSVPAHEVLKPRFPVIDAHNHLMEPYGGGWDKKPLVELLDILDQADVHTYVDLDGGWGEGILENHLDLFKAKQPERFAIFGGVDWNAWADHGDRFGDWAAGRLRAQQQRGAQGLKIWKPFGLQVKDPQGNVARINDPRLDAIWEIAGELHLPVIIHVADPVAFFLPLDPTNERWEELHAHPDWHFPSPPFPGFARIIADLADLVSRHPRTTFIGAHVGCYAENLAWVGALLDRCLNFHVDIAGRIGELGRQPYTARRFFLKYADRILFGTDVGPDLEQYRLHYRFLETNDEYFNYSTSEIPGQGRWYVYGMYLPGEVLEKIYYRNAQKLIIQPKENHD